MNKRDTDGDYLDDGVELYAWGSEWDLNYDNDSIQNNLLDLDSDNDGLKDGLEFGPSGLLREGFFVVTPRSADTDEDGLTDCEEGTNGFEGAEGARRIYQAHNTSKSNGEGQFSEAFTWSGEDEIGRYMLGAFHVRLYSIRFLGMESECMVM